MAVSRTFQQTNQTLWIVYPQACELVQDLRITQVQPVGGEKSYFVFHTHYRPIDGKQFVFRKAVDNFKINGIYWPVSRMDNHQKNFFFA